MVLQQNARRHVVCLSVIVLASSLLAGTHLYMPWADIDIIPTLKLVTSGHQRHTIYSLEPGQFNRLEVQTTGNFTERIRQFNDALSRIRRVTVQRGGFNGSWKNEIDPNNITVILGLKDGYQKELTSCTHLTAVVLPWKNVTSGPRTKPWNSLTDYANLLYQVYYEWTADNTLCTWIETPGVIKLKYDVILNKTCNRNINDTAKQRSLAPVFLNTKPMNLGGYWPNGGNAYPDHFHTDQPDLVTYIYIHHDALVTGLGDVFSKNCKLVLFGCSLDTNTNPGNVDTWPTYDEIFVITQYWGTAVFHRMVELVPRMAIELDFLRSNPQIRIAAAEADGGRMAQILNIFGIDSSRLVTGSLRGKLVYQPRSTPCGTPLVQESQVANKLYREYIKRSFPAQPRNRLLVIRRSGSRRFTEQKGIEEAAERLAREYKLNFTLFRDDPTPTFNDTMQLFNSAVMVVAPVGAGESNLFFSEPGTYVIEGVCNLPHVNLCFQHLTHILGMHWHGVTSHGGCESVVDVAASEVENAMLSYLRIWSHDRSLVN